MCGACPCGQFVSCPCALVHDVFQKTLEKPICDCAANYLVSHHDTVTLTKLGASAQSEESQQVVSAAVDACLTEQP